MEPTDPVGRGPGHGSPQDPSPPGARGLLPAPPPRIAPQSSDPVLLADLNQGARKPYTSSLDRGLLASDATHAWFATEDPRGGTWLMRTDGSPAGTVPVFWFVEDPRWEDLDAVVLDSGSLIVSLRAPGLGVSLLAQHPGQSSLQPLAIIPSASMAEDHRIVVWHGVAWFAVLTASGVPELWRSDGTPAGTTRIEDLSTLWQPRDAPQLEVLDGELWIRDQGDADSLFASKAAPGARAVLLRDPTGQPFRAYRIVARVARRILYVLADQSSYPSSSQLWSTAGTLQDAVLLASVYPGMQRLARIGDTLFLYTPRGSAAELWATRGTPTTTFQLDDDALPIRNWSRLEPGVEDAVAWNGRLIYPTSDDRLWSSDGTPRGTSLLADYTISSSYGYRRASHLVAGDGGVWFEAPGAGIHRTLWHTDGTPAGTTERNLSLGQGLARTTRQRPMCRLTNGLLLDGTEALHGGEPWLLDPTNGTTTLLADLRVDAVNGGLESGPMQSNGQFVLLEGKDSYDRTRVVVSDGTPAGTRQLPEPLARDRGVDPFADLPLAQLFMVSTVGQPAELWATDGTPSGTQHLRTFPNEMRRVRPRPGGVLGGACWFHLEHSDEVWKTDGTAAGTQQVTWTAPLGSWRPWASNGRLLFGVGDSPGHGREPWISDGTPTGTRLLIDAVPGGQGSDPTGFQPFGAGVLFSTRAADGTDRIWFSDGSTAGTRELLANGTRGYLVDWGYAGTPRIQVGGRHAWFSYVESARGALPWVTDGTPEGTRRAIGDATIPSALYPGFPAVAGDRLFFKPARHDDIFVTDGTATGSHLLFGGTAAKPYLHVSDPTPIDSDHVLFQASDIQHGRELWISDGSPAGTRRLTDLAPGYRSTDIRSIQRIGRKLVFAANDLVHGLELHALDLAAVGGSAVREFGLGCGARLQPGTGSARIGRLLELHVDAAPTAVGGLYLDDEIHRGRPTPACEILLPDALLLTAFVTDASGRQTLPMGLPDDPRLIGLQVFLQAAIAEQGGPYRGGARLTTGVELVIGR